MTTLSNYLLITDQNCLSHMGKGGKFQAALWQGESTVCLGADRRNAEGKVRKNSATHND